MKKKTKKKTTLSSYQNFLPYKLDNLDESAVVCASVCAQSLGPSKLPPQNCISHSRPPLPFSSIKKFLRNTSKPDEGRRKEGLLSKGTASRPSSPLLYSWVGQWERFNLINYRAWENCDTVANYTWDLTHDTGQGSIMCCHPGGNYLMYLVIVFHIICIMSSDFSFQSVFFFSLDTKKCPASVGNKITMKDPRQMHEMGCY